MMTAEHVDQRAIGELLLDADAQARQLLLDATGDDARAMLRTWGEVVQAAGDLWSALPVEPGGSPADGATLAQIEAMSRAMHRAQLTHGWPGEGPTDERLSALTDTLRRAGELAAGPGQRVRLATEPARADLRAARMRTMHTLYVGAHAVGVAVRQHVRDTEATTSPRSARARRDVPRGVDASVRLASMEQLAGGYVGTRYSLTMAGQHYAPPANSERLRQAVATWDIQVHRTLASTPSPANLHLAANAQAALATTGAALLGAATRAGHVDQDAYTQRLAPALEHTQQAWTQSAGRWATLTTRGDRADPDLVHAAGELRAAAREITVDRVGWADAPTIAGRIDLTQAAPIIHQALAAAAELACVHRDVVDQEPTLTGPARVLAAWTRDSLALAVRDAAPVVAPVRPEDIRLNRIVPLTDVVRHTLLTEAEQLVDLTQTAMSVGSVLAHAPRDRGPADQAQAEAGCARCRPDERVGTAGAAMQHRPVPR